MSLEAFRKILTERSTSRDKQQLFEAEFTQFLIAFVKRYPDIGRSDIAEAAQDIMRAFWEANEPKNSAQLELTGLQVPRDANGSELS
jgi:hypothetical protein